VTIDDPIERLEHITAGWIEQSRKDYEENRRLWRESKAEIDALWKATDRRFAELAEEGRETDRRFKETDARFKETERLLRESAQRADERVENLVLAIGELCQRLDNQRSSQPHN
jgi:hypothetical protein